MKQKILKIHPADNVLVALVDLPKCELLRYEENEYKLIGGIPAKHLKGLCK